MSKSKEVSLLRTSSVNINSALWPPNVTLNVSQDPRYKSLKMRKLELEGFNAVVESLSFESSTPKFRFSLYPLQKHCKRYHLWVGTYIKLNTGKMTFRTSC